MVKRQFNILYYNFKFVFIGVATDKPMKRVYVVVITKKTNLKMIEIIVFGTEICII